MNSWNTPARTYAPGIGDAVADRTINRKLDPVTRAELPAWTEAGKDIREFTRETWEEVALRVAHGNATLNANNAVEVEQEFHPLHHHLRQASILMSGRHLQHTDTEIASRNMEVLTNCLEGSTRILTQEYGPVEIEKIVGEVVTVTAGDGKQRPAMINKHGEQRVYEISFRQNSSGGGKFRKRVAATANHRWKLRDGSITTELKVGDVIAPIHGDVGIDPVAVVHGLVFGDGSAHKRRADHAKVVNSVGREYATIRVCKQDAARVEIHEWLDAAGYRYTMPVHAGGDRVYYIGKLPFSKDAPHTRDPEYIAGFIYGWWLADGAKNTQHAMEISTANQVAAEWLTEHCAYAGYSVTMDRTQERREGDGSFVNGKPLRTLRLRKGVEWKVDDIVESDVVPVYCPEEPVTGTFVLANGLLTGNCSTAAASFIEFYLLLNGSGVGRSYDDDMMVLDWTKQPRVYCAIRDDHPDVLSGEIKNYLSLDLAHQSKTAVFYKVPDSREGWAKAIEQVERMTWEGKHDATLVLDFSDVRHRGSPIGGMQNRPASGPGPLMLAIQQTAQLRGADMLPFEACMHVDHYFAECVLVGGARRAARMATKTWRDKSVFNFIQIKRGGKLWSSNNSVTVDAEFWAGVKRVKEGPYEEVTPLDLHAYDVFSAICEASYHDGTGEPGLINVDKLTQKDESVEVLFDGDFAHSDRFQLDEATKGLTAQIARVFAGKRYNMITNPCVTADTWVQTSEGPRQVSELIDKPFKAVVNGEQHQATGFWKTGDKQVFRLKTARGYEVRATADHKFLVESSRKRRADGTYNVEQEWVELQHLQPGDKLVLNNLTIGAAVPKGWSGAERDLGWLLGEMVGDGGHNPGKYRGYVRFWGHQESARIAHMAAEIIQGLPDTYKAPTAFNGKPSYNPINDTWQIASRKLDTLAQGLITEGDKQILPALEKKSPAFVSGFLRGMFDADGSVQGSVSKGVSVRLAQSCLNRLQAVQRMLLRLGIASTIYENRTPEHEKQMPTGVFGPNAPYLCKPAHELVISKNNVIRFGLFVGFHDENKSARLDELLQSYGKRGAYQERFTAEVASIEEDGIEAVYDCTVDEIHRFDANGVIVHNCGEIPLSMVGGYCVIADVVPFHAKPESVMQDVLRNGMPLPMTDLNAWDADAEDAFRTAVRALMRVNTMDCLYGKEVARTNRIGVGFTGIHEYAFARFGYGWKQLVNEQASLPFWQMMSRFSSAVVDEAVKYAEVLGVAEPHTATTVKPAGTTSKLFGLTEGAHLPSMREYLRWVQFRSDDPLIEQYRAAGYPVRELKTYSGTTVVGFPTVPTICKLGMGDLLVTAAEATPEEQYEWLRLLEKYWLAGYSEDQYGPFVHDMAGQVSYTLKYDPKVVGFTQFTQTLLDGQSTIKACSVMPQTDATAYEYQPEEPVTSDRFQEIVAAISDPKLKQDIGFEHVDCSSGSCPIDFSREAA